MELMVHGLWSHLTLMQLLTRNWTNLACSRFSLELNSLSAALLQACGYQVTIVEANVLRRTFYGVAPSHTVSA
jgi:hypothetical protein